MRIADFETMDISQQTNGELFVLLASLMRELRRRDLVRTANNPVADLGELIFCGAMGWQREHNQGKDIDAITPNRERVQIKSRRTTREKDSTRSGTIYDQEGWDLIALAMFDQDFRIKRATLIPKATALAHMKWSNRQKGWYISLTKRFWQDADLIDVTELLSSHCDSIFLRTM